MTLHEAVSICRGTKWTFARASWPGLARILVLDAPKEVFNPGQPFPELTDLVEVHYYPNMLVERSRCVFMPLAEDILADDYEVTQ